MHCSVERLELCVKSLLFRELFEPILFFCICLIITSFVGYNSQRYLHLVYHFVERRGTCQTYMVAFSVMVFVRLDKFYFVLDVISFSHRQASTHSVCRTEWLSIVSWLRLTLETPFAKSLETNDRDVVRASLSSLESLLFADADADAASSHKDATTSIRKLVDALGRSSDFRVKSLVRPVIEKFFNCVWSMVVSPQEGARLPRLAESLGLTVVLLCVVSHAWLFVLTFPEISRIIYDVSFVRRIALVLRIKAAHRAW